MFCIRMQIGKTLATAFIATELYGTEGPDERGRAAPTSLADS